ncbi:MAG: carboxypeptidase-like regulatory domain-containing protein, partial [Pyrinomonadaceae bacterium]
MKNLINCALTLMCTLLIALTAMAQTSTTGLIEGKVADQNGAVVPGVTVNVTSVNLIRPQSATTDANGNFRIPNLPPGKYTVTVEPFQGFAKYEQLNTEVNLSTTTTVEIALAPQGASTSVEVVANSGEAIDTNSNTTGTN